MSRTSSRTSTLSGQARTSSASSLHGQDKRDGDGKVAGGRPVRRWSPRPLLRPWCRCPLAAAVAAHTWWVGDRRLTLRPRQPACRMSGLEAAEGASRSDNRQPRAANCAIPRPGLFPQKYSDEKFMAKGLGGRFRRRIHSSSSQLSSFASSPHRSSTPGYTTTSAAAS